MYGDCFPLIGLLVIIHILLLIPSSHGYSLYMSHGYISKIIPLSSEIENDYRGYE